MIINYIHRVGWFVGLILLQVLILNNVHIAGVATPFLYVPETNGWYGVSVWGLPSISFLIPRV